jgi:hypothetical protein
MYYRVWNGNWTFIPVPLSSSYKFGKNSLGKRTTEKVAVSCQPMARLLLPSFIANFC